MSRKSWIIQFRRLEGDKYTVFVDRPGDANDFTAVLPPSIEDLWAKPQRKATDVRGGTRKFRKDVASLPIHQQFFSAENPETLQDIGDRMLSAVFNPENNQLGQDNIAALKTLMSLNDGLDIEFDLSQTPELSGVPWEALYVNSTDSFLAANPNTNVVRRIRAQCEAPEKIEGPVRLLVVASNPKGDLDVTKEMNAIEQRVEKIGNSQMIFDKLEDATRDALSDKIADYQPHILHYIGHSDFEEDEGAQGEGYLFLHGEEDGDGETSIDRLSSADLKTMMQHNRPALAVLNSCESGVTSITSPKAGLAQCLVGRINIPFVVAMQNPVSDQAAIAFSTRFYASIARGDSIATAVTKGRSKISENGNEWVKLELITPVLYTSNKTRLDEALVIPVTKNAKPEKTDVDPTDNKEKSSRIGKKTIWGSIGGALAGTALLISQVEDIVEFGTKTLCWIGIGQCSAESSHADNTDTSGDADQNVKIVAKVDGQEIEVHTTVDNAGTVLERLGTGRRLNQNVESSAESIVQATARTRASRSPSGQNTPLEMATLASDEGYTREPVRRVYSSAPYQGQLSGEAQVLIGGGAYTPYSNPSPPPPPPPSPPLAAPPPPPPPPAPPPPPSLAPPEQFWPIAKRYAHMQNGGTITAWPSPFPVVQCDRADFGDNVEFASNSNQLSENAAIPIWSAANAIEICNARYVNVTSYPGELVEVEARELSFQRGELVAGGIIATVPHLPIEISIGSEVWEPSMPPIIDGANSVTDSDTAYPYNGATEVPIDQQSEGGGAISGSPVACQGERLAGARIGCGIAAADEAGNAAPAYLQHGSTAVPGPEMSVQPTVQITSAAICPSLEDMAGSVFFAPDSDQLDEKARESIRKAVSGDAGPASAEREIHLSAFSRRTWQMDETGSMLTDIDILEYGRLVSVANYIASLPGYLPEDIKGGMYGSMCHNYDLPGADSLQYHQVDIKIVSKTPVDIAKGTYHRTSATRPVHDLPPVTYGQPTGPPGGLLIGRSLPVEDPQANEPILPSDD